MKGENSKKEEELLDIDEEGNPIKKKDEDEPKGSSKINYYYFIIPILMIIIILLIAFLMNSGNNQHKRSIFDKTSIKNLKLKNRVISAAMFDSYLEDGKISEKGLEKYENLAKNDVAIILTGGSSVSPFINPILKGSFRIDKDDFIDVYKPLIDIVHKYNSYIFMQISHAGLHGKDDIIYSPSINKGFSQDKNSIKMTKDDIFKIEDDFANAALRAKKSCFDGIDIHGAHLTLITSFLSSIIIEEQMNMEVLMKIELDF